MREFAYLPISSLRVYALIDQESAAIVVHRRTEQGFVREVYEGPAAVIPLREIETELPLAEIYDGVAFSPAAPDKSEQQFAEATSEFASCRLSS